MGTALSLVSSTRVPAYASAGGDAIAAPGGRVAARLQVQDVDLRMSNSELYILITNGLHWYRVLHISITDFNVFAILLDFAQQTLTIVWYTN